jgi:hypothetical protein
MRVLLNDNIRVYGGLLGVVSGKKIEVMTSFEFVNKSTSPGNIEIDLNFLEERKTLTDQLFPLYQVLGFYSTSKDGQHQSMDKDLLKSMEFLGVLNSVYVVLGTDLTNVNELPISTYEYNRNSKEYKKLSYTIDSSDPERICLDTIIKASDLQNNDSAITKNMVTLKNALGMLKWNLKLINDNLNENFLRDPEFVMQIDSIIKNYPDVINPDLNNLITSSFEEILILNNICSGCVALNFQGRCEDVNGGEKNSRSYYR